MFHALFDLESDLDPHPNTDKAIETVCYGFVECRRNKFRTNFIIYSGLNIFGIEDLNTN